MKAILGGRIYDTDTAALMVPMPKQDYSIGKTKSGNFFTIDDHGNPARAVTEKEARSIAEKNRIPLEDYEKLFGPVTDA